MWPTIVSVGPIAIHSWGLMVAIGVFLGGFSWWQRAKEEGCEEEKLMDGWIIAGLAALVLARVWYVLTEWSQFSGSLYRMIFMFKYPGLSYEGALVAGLAALSFYVYKQKWAIWQVMELAVFAWLIVEGWGTLGSFLSGSNLGKPTSWFWGIGFPGVEGRRHPVQLVTILALLALYWLVKKWEKEYRSFKWYQNSKGEAKPGFLLAVYLIGLGLIRLLTGMIAVKNNWGFNVCLILFGGLILLLRSGIKIELVKPSSGVKPLGMPEHKRKIKRKKQGFDFK